MRYRDIFNPPPPNTVLLHVRQGEMARLEALILTTDVRLHGPIRPMPTGGAFVNVTCRDAAAASALLVSW